MPHVSSLRLKLFVLEESATYSSDGEMIQSHLIWKQFLFYQPRWCRVCCILAYFRSWLNGIARKWINDRHTDKQKQQAEIRCIGLWLETASRPEFWCFHYVLLNMEAVVVESSLHTVNIWRVEIYGDIFCIHCQHSHLDHKKGIASPPNFTQGIFVTYTGQRYWNPVILYGCILVNGILSRFVHSKTPLLPTHIFGCWKVVYYW